MGKPPPPKKKIILEKKLLTKLEPFLGLAQLSQIIFFNNKTQAKNKPNISSAAQNINIIIINIHRILNFSRYVRTVTGWKQRCKENIINT